MMLPSEYLELGFTQSENAVSYHGNRVAPDHPDAAAWTPYGAIGVAWANGDITERVAQMFFNLLYTYTERDQRAWTLKATQSDAVALMRRIEDHVRSMDEDFVRAEEIFQTKLTLCQNCDKPAPRYLTWWSNYGEFCVACPPGMSTEDKVAELRTWRESAIVRE